MSQTQPTYSEVLARAVLLDFVNSGKLDADANWKYAVLTSLAARVLPEQYPSSCVPDFVWEASIDDLVLEKSQDETECKYLYIRNPLNQGSIKIKPSFSEDELLAAIKVHRVLECTQLFGGVMDSVLPKLWDDLLA